MEQLELELKNYGQDHLTQFWSTLSTEERNELLRDIKEYIFCLFVFPNNS